MKRIIFLLLLGGPSVWAQQLHFGGTIKGIADESLKMQLPADHFGRVSKQDISVSKGAFSALITIPASGWMKLSYHGKDREVFAWKYADSLKIVFEADFLEYGAQMTLSGDGANISAFEDELNKRFGAKLSIEWLNGQAKDASNIDALEMETFRLRNEAISLLEKHQPALPAQFVQAYKNHFSYYYYLSLFKFSEARSASSNIPKATEVPKVLIEGLTWDRMNRSSELDSRFFRAFLLQFVNYKALENYDFMKFADRHTSVQEAYNLARENLKGEVLQYFLTQTLLAHAANVQPSLLRQMHEQLRKTENAEAMVKLVDDSLASRLAAKDDLLILEITDVQKPKDEIDVEVQGLDGKNFKLSELKGKVVYLDVWASWCGPCRKEFPHSKTLKDKLSNKEKKSIEFLYISIDNTETVWKLAIEELGIEGLHGLSKGGWGSEVTAKFKVSSIPRYLILDKKGNIVDGNAPRPSDRRLLEILQKLATQ